MTPFGLNLGKNKNTKPNSRALVFVGSMSEKLYAFDIASGRQVWQFDAGGWVETTPAVYREVLVGSLWNMDTDFMQVFSLEASTGKKLWAIEPEWGETTSPAIYDGKVFIGSRQDGALHALDMQNGNEVWSLQSESSVISTPVISDGTIFVGSNDHNIYAIEATSGKKLWKSPIESEILYSPAIAGGLVIAGCMNGNVCALRMSDGRRFGPSTKVTKYHNQLPSPARECSLGDVTARHMHWT